MRPGCVLSWSLFIKTLTLKRPLSAAENVIVVKILYRPADSALKSPLCRAADEVVWPVPSGDVQSVTLYHPTVEKTLFSFRLALMMIFPKPVQESTNNDFKNAGWLNIPLYCKTFC